MRLKRRSFVRGSGALATFFPFCAKAEKGTTQTHPFSFFYHRNEGCVFYRSCESSSQVALRHGFLISQNSQWDFNENNALAFHKISGANSPLGILTSLRQRMGTRKPSFLNDGNVFQFFKFGFLLWNNQTQQLDLSGILEEETPVYSVDGMFVTVELATLTCPLIFKP